MLTVYEDALGRISKIESSIKKQQKIETNDQNSDQTGLEENLDGNESKKRPPLKLRVVMIQADIKTVVRLMVM